MLAKSRTINENGRTRKVEMNSIGTTKTSRNAGTPGGISEFFRYVKPPWRLMPMTLKNIHVASASTIGIAKRALAGNCTAGKISVMLLKKMKKKRVVRYG